MESIISTFHIDWKIIIAQAVNFGVVFVVLYIFALKPLVKLMAERSEKIGKGLDDAKTSELLIEKTKQEYRDMIDKAKVEANKIWEEGKREAETNKVLMMEDAKKEMALVMENGKKMLEGEKQKMMAEAKKEIVELAMKAAEKIVEGSGQSFNQKVIKELNNL